LLNVCALHGERSLTLKNPDLANKFNIAIAQKNYTHLVKKNTKHYKGISGNSGHGRSGSHKSKNSSLVYETPVPVGSSNSAGYEVPVVERKSKKRSSSRSKLPAPPPRTYQPKITLV
jgi:hypothetical protein